MNTTSDWSIPGAASEAIIGNTHAPDGEPKGVIVVAHGFKGYKDYGMFPRIATHAAGAGFVAHRFNFSHSGMTDAIESFERVDLFEQDTWNKQVHDLLAIVRAIEDGTLAGGGRPLVLFGHSRGGAAALLAAGRHADDGVLGRLAGVVSAAAPSMLNILGPDQQAELLREGFLVSPSSRTGQDLRIGTAFLTEQQQDPEGHDLLVQAARIRCPVLLVHGRSDPSVPFVCAQQLASVIGDHATLRLLDDTDHVFNTPNPFPPEDAPSPQLRTLLDELVDFAGRCCSSRAPA